MDADEWQVLELVGAYLFVVEFVPRAWFEAQQQPVELAASEESKTSRLWWEHCQPRVSVAGYLDERLMRGDTWPYEHELTQTSWTDENFHRIDLWESAEGDVRYLEASIDARYDYAGFISRVADFAMISDCLLFIEKEQSFLEPSEVDIYSAISRSSAARRARENAVTSRSH